MASNSPTCGVCDSLGLPMPAVVWCSDCDEGLCMDCEKRHGVSKATKKHQTIPVETYQKLPTHILNIKQICNVHEEKYQTYCKKHDCLCCHKCVIEEHNKCQELKAIDEIIQDVKRSNAFLELEETLSQLTENVAKLIKTKELNITSLKDERKNIEREISDVRNKVNEHLDNIQEKLIKKLTILEGKKNKQINTLVKKIKEREKVINEFKTTLTQVKEHASELQVFFAMKGLEKDIMKEEQNLKALYTGDAFEEKHLVFKVNISMRHLSQSIEDFGQVTIESKQSRVTFDRRKDREAQTKIQNVATTSVNSLTLSLVKSFNTGFDCTSCVSLPDGRSVFTLSKQSIIRVIRPDGNCDFDIPLKTLDIHGVCFIPSINSLAATCTSHFSKDSIKIIDLQFKEITNSVSVGEMCHGITYGDKDVLIFATKKGILTLNLTDNSIQPIITHQTPGKESYVASFGNNVYCTSNLDSKLASIVSPCDVTCCDFQGKIKWQFQNISVLKQPKAITVDQEGFIYVAGCGSENVVVLKPDGSQHAVLLTGLPGLTGISFNTSTNQLLVSDYYGEAFLYDVKRI